MKTDKELLELAAKAAGLNVKMIEVDCDDNFRALVVGKKNTKERIAWNPLTDDGDALRLAVKLDMLINPDNGTINTCSATGGFADVFEYIAGDKLAATRRAIVRAAAAIGERL